MKTIAGVPDSITKEQYMQLVDALRSVGFDVNELRSVQLSTDGVYACIKARDTAGKHLFEDGRNRLAEHRIYVAVQWEDVGENPPTGP